MEQEKREKLGHEISASILKHITELEKAMAHDCLDYGQLTRKEKENLTGRREIADPFLGVCPTMNYSPPAHGCVSY